MKNRVAFRQSKPNKAISALLQERSLFSRGSRRALSVTLTAVLSGFAQQALAQDAVEPATTPPAAKCDPYQNYSCLDDYLGQGFFERLGNYYSLEMGKDGPPVDPKAPPGRRDDFPPQAQPIPPMPFTEWPYGGTTSLGVTRPNSVDSPLMSALGNTKLGALMGENNIQVYGWINAGGNLSTNTIQPGGNAPAAYGYIPNKLAFDQAVIYAERLPDTVQKDHIDWGFRMSAIYGTNYRYTTSFGLASDQLLVKNKPLGYDFPMVYGEIYNPFIAKGLLIRFGRYISVPDIEAQLGPNNYMYSHSMTYTYDNYTNTGVIASLAATKNLILQGGISAGTDTTVNNLSKKVANPFPNNPLIGQVNPLFPGAKFKADPGAQPTLTLCARYTSDDGADNINGCANGINNGTYGYNNLQWFGVTYYHKFSDKWHIAVELYNEHQNNVPNANNAVVQNVYANNGSPFSSQFMPFNAPNLAQCKNVASLTCKAQATGFVTYLNYSPDTRNNFSIRPEIFNDPQGQRTGTAAKYTNLAVGWQHWLSPQITIRPEIAYYHANKPAFNGNSNAGIAGTKSSATIVSMDFIYHF